MFNSSSSDLLAKRVQSAREGERQSTVIDEDQQIKYEQIIDLLLAGGYFRARIQGLAPFDKVVGGMSWCITNCNEDLDIDLFFQEESSIGQRMYVVCLQRKTVPIVDRWRLRSRLYWRFHRSVVVSSADETTTDRWNLQYNLERIANDVKLSTNLSFSKLGENIIRALNRMKCPFKLDSHQIQGGANTADYINIFPIIQWLVKKVIETRQETGDLMRLFSESQFNKSHKLPEDVQFDEHKQNAIDFVDNVFDRYKPLRKYRRQGRRVPYLNKKTQEESIQSVLLEYGDFYVAPKISSSKGQSEFAQNLEKSLGGKPSNKNQDEDDEEKRKRQELKKEMTQYIASGRVDKDIVGNLLPTNIDELESQYQYDEAEGEMGQNQQKYGMKLHEQQVHKLERDIAEQKALLTETKKKYEDSDRHLKEIQTQYNKKSAYNQRIAEEIAKLDALETPENTKQIQMLRTLVGLNENLKSQEAKFKANCKRQLTSLREQIEKIKSEITEVATGTGEVATVNENFNKTLEKLKKARQLLAKRNRDIALIERKIDEIPERSELGQYQRQFVELYEQVSSKFTETRQYYNFYNTLEDSKAYLSKELSILNSINDGYKGAMASKSSREQFIASLSTISQSVLQSLEKVEQKLGVEKDSKMSLTEKYNSLVEKERLYFKATKEFLEECKKNELLQSKMS